MASFRKRDQRGDGKIGMIIGILVVVTIGYLVAKWVPVRTQNAEFQEFVVRSAQRFSIGELSEEKLIATILEYSAKEHIPVTEPDITVVANTEKVMVKVRYHVDIALVGGQVWTQNYDVVSDTPRF